MTFHTPSITVPTTSPRGHAAAVLCAVGSAAAVAVIPLAGGAAGSDGLAVADDLVASSTRVQWAAVLAAVAAAALILAAVRLGRHVGGTAGAVMTISGAAVSIFLGAYYATFAAGAVVASYLYDETSAGVGDATLVLLNMVEMTRYAPGLALTVAAVTARRSLPRPLVVAAGVLALMFLMPFTAWVAALAVAVWLGVAAAVVAWRGDVSGA